MNGLKVVPENGDKDIPSFAIADWMNQHLFGWIQLSKVLNTKLFFPI